MTQMVAGFDWDEANRVKCRKHGVSIEEIEAVLRSGRLMRSPDPHRDEARTRAVGRAETGRSVFVVYTLRERDGKLYIRPISARFMHGKEVESYEKEALARPSDG